MTRHDPQDSQRIRITAYSVVSALGRGRGAHLDAMRTGRSGLTNNTIPDLPFECYLGQVEGVEDIVLPSAVAAFDNRLNRLAAMALETDNFTAKVSAMRQRWGADRCGVVIGTSTSGVEKLERVYRARDDGAPMPPYSMRHHDNHQAAPAFLQENLGLTGPAYAVSTACSSSAKSLIDAVQLIETGVCDAVLTGGVDSLCLSALNGFEALQLVSRKPARPCDSARDGLSIGEGAALMIVERDSEGARLSGSGESSDGISMSTPPEDGAGAAMAMRAALEGAGLSAIQIGYINLHGTATPINDTSECAAVSAVLGNAIPASSLKGAIGHTLGAAGGIEAVMCLIAMEESVIPGNPGLESLDPAIHSNVIAASQSGELDHVLSNAFGFGGNNCSLVLSR